MRVLFAAIVLVVLAGFPTLPVRAAGTIGDVQADMVRGQPNLFQAGCRSPTASSLCTPYQATLDAAGDMFVADVGNNRVLMYPARSGHPATTATKVFGQTGSFTTTTVNTGGLSASSLSGPTGVAVDANGTLFVSDYGNNRVLVYFHATSKPANPSADLVLGQSDFTNNQPDAYTRYGPSCPSSVLVPPVSPCSLFDPYFLSLDANGDLLVAEPCQQPGTVLPGELIQPSTGELRVIVLLSGHDGLGPVRLLQHQ